MELVEVPWARSPGLCPLGAARPSPPHPSPPFHLARPDSPPARAAPTAHPHAVLSRPGNPCHPDLRSRPWYPSSLLLHTGLLLPPGTIFHLSNSPTPSFSLPLLLHTSLCFYQSPFGWLVSRGIQEPHACLAPLFDLVAAAASAAVHPLLFACRLCPVSELDCRTNALVLPDKQVSLALTRKL